MPQLNVKALIDEIKGHCLELHDIYVLEKDFSLAERILDEVFRLEKLIKTLETLL